MPPPAQGSCTSHEKCEFEKVRAQAIRAVQANGGFHGYS
jgi:hypothetical protein